MTSPADSRTPWRNTRWAFAAVWLLFLGYPIVAVLGSGDSIPIKVYALTVIAVFAAVYVSVCVYVMTNDAEPTREDVVRGLVLIVLACALLPVLHSAAFGLAPFVMAAAAFTFPPAGQLAAMIGTIVAAFALPEIFGWRLDLGVVAIIAAVGLSMLFARQMQTRERDRARADARQREVDEQLAVVAERERVARDVHDILGHSLTVISVKTELLGRLVDLDPERAKAEAADVNALAREALAEVRATVGQLRNPELPTVLASVRSALDAAGIAADVPDAPVPPNRNAALFAWVLREAVTNVVRHSGASSCSVVLAPDRIVVRDDGRGMGDAPRGHGLTGLAERVADAGGVLTVESGAAGTVVRAQVAAPGDERGE